MAFMGHYYRTLVVNLAGLGNFYDGGSMLTFEGQKIQGSQNIMAKLTSLPFQQCQHNIATVDCRPSAGGGMFVSGFDVSPSISGLISYGSLKLAFEVGVLMESNGFSSTMLWL
ncbi:nuclear transport factor 2-like [Durio zibethinus]|uniref:Nuclear transport factor 2-like n=1 Tax=Durio zibethinus TaxID=66656 RepID=A0A6P5Y5E6_DURZI|nr:nuclear transport factor 2-like [Durio zibethinus]